MVGQVAAQVGSPWLARPMSRPGQSATLMQGGGPGNFSTVRAYGCETSSPTTERIEMKTFAQLSAVGVVAVLLLKLLGLVAVPLLGFLAAAFAFSLKILLMAGAAWFIWNLIRKSGCCGTREEE